MSTHPKLTGEWSVTPRDPELPGDDLTVIERGGGEIQLTDGEASIQGTKMDLRRTV